MAENTDSQFVGAMKFLGGVAGFFWGGHLAGQDPEVELWLGLIIGAIMGAAAGWVAGKSVEATYHILVVLIFVGATLLYFLHILGLLQRFAS